MFHLIDQGLTRRHFVHYLCDSVFEVRKCQINFVMIEINFGDSKPSPLINNTSPADLRGALAGVRGVLQVRQLCN